MSFARKPIAYLSREVVASAASNIIKGTLSAAREAGQDLVVFHGGQLGKEAAARCYDLITMETFAGVISWASSDNDSSVSYLDRFAGHPLVSVSIKLESRPCTIADNYAGMFSAVAHLIEVHGLRKIAFVRGPAQHISAKERWQAYQDTLKKFDIPEDPRLVHGPVSWDKVEGPLAVKQFLDTEGLRIGKDLEAIVCVNDNIAIGVLEELQRRNISVPGQLAIVGSNDTKEARCTTPPITSVAMPFREQGAESLAMILSLMQGQKVDDRRLPAKLVIGQSCGCTSKKVEEAASPEGEIGGETSLIRRLLRPDGQSLSSIEAEDHQPAIAAISDSILATANVRTASGELLNLISAKLYRAFLAELAGEARGGYLHAVSEILRTIVGEGLNIDVLHSAISAMRQHFLARLSAQDVRRAEDLWAQSRVMISETSVRFKESEYLKVVGQEHALHTIGAKLITTYDVAKLKKILFDELPKLGIKSFYLVLYEGDADWDRQSVPERGRVLMAYNDQGRIEIEEAGRSFACREFLPADIISGQTHTLMVEPLFFQTQQFGYAVFDIGPEEFVIYETLRTQLSSALYGVLLLEENAKVRSTLQLTLKSMERQVAEVSASSETINQNVQGGSSAMEEVAASIREIAKNIQNTLGVVKQAVELSENANADIERLRNQSMEIDKIVGLITDIAERTKILSFNAAIEAARAGQAGRGFAVVSKEVKELALNTVASANDVSAMVGKIQESSTQSSKAIVGLRKVVGMIADLSDQMNQSIVEQEVAANEISRLLIDAAQGTQQIAHSLAAIEGIGQSITTG